MEREIINCPNCKGAGKITKTDSLNFGLMGAFTFGLLNVMDGLMSSEWNVECERCDGLGKIKVKIKEE
jgi:RecJ-like exonuclease